MKESELVRYCLDWLALNKILAWRSNSGAVTATYKGKKRYIRFAGIKGLSDIVGILPTGQFIAIECKTAKGVVSEQQREFLDRVRMANGRALVVRRPQDMDNIVGPWL